MSLTNVEKPASSGGQRSLPKKGPRPAVLSGIIDIGVQQRSYQGEKKRPAREFIPVFTLTKDTYEVDGDVVQMRLQPFPIKALAGTTRGKYYEFIQAMDPEGDVVPNGVGDITKLLGKGCFVNVGHSDPKGDEGTVYPEIRGLSALPEDYPVGETDGKVLFFDMDNPSKEVFDGFPDYIKAHIRSSEQYIGSKTEQFLESDGGSENTPSGSSGPDDTDEDSPI
jgi:hypothetical protein